MAGSKHARSGSQVAATLEEVVDVQATSHVKKFSGPPLPPISQERREQSMLEKAYDVDTLAEPASPDASPDNQAATVLYLAYGSNLCAETFRVKRGIRPLAEVNVTAPEIRLTFDLPGLPYAEPCFANVQWKKKSSQEPPNGLIPEETSEHEPLLGAADPPPHRRNGWKKGLVGVVYEVTKQDYATIFATEGGGTGYQDILVTCYPLPDAATVPDKPDTKPFKAHTLCAPDSSPAVRLKATVKNGRRKRPDPDYAQPSARYLKLITDGADEHDLPSEYQVYLHQLRPYTITQSRQRVGRFVFMVLWGPALLTLFAGHRIFADKEGRSPKWFVKLSETLFMAVWTSYDVFFKKIFGDGERTASPETDGKLAEKHSTLRNGPHLVDF
ncbi:MAG: hypothetical protein M1823_005651 [Watsoniomyces obsoletus]|nr:MAG: hypothetical protein M1823_005651 [Watsoniomyces obsoletus]